MDRAKYKKTWKAYCATSVGNKALTRSIAKEVTGDIDSVYDTMDAIEKALKSGSTNFNELKRTASNASGICKSTIITIRDVIDGSAMKDKSPLAKKLVIANKAFFKVVFDFNQNLDKSFKANKTVDADIALNKRAPGLITEYKDIMKNHASHMMHVRNLSIYLNKCLDKDVYEIKLVGFLKADLKGHSAKGPWSKKFCDDLIKVLAIQANNVKKNTNAYGGYGGAMVDLITTTSGFFTFVSDDAKKKNAKLLKTSQQAKVAIDKGLDLMIPGMANKMITAVQKKKATLRV